jgi:hypothetical protein
MPGADDQIGMFATEKTAEAVRDRVLDSLAMTHTDWIDRVAMPAIEQLARSRTEFTTDDVWYLVGEDSPREPRALGAAMRQAARARLIRKTGVYRNSRRTDCHARPVAIWVGR